MNYRSQGRGIFIKNNTFSYIDKIDAIIFDCDGVLVNVSKSYDLAIKQTTAYVLKKFAGIKSIPITHKIINEFKTTGGFNDEVDVTYASILSLIAAHKLGKDPEKFVSSVAKSADSTGIKSVEESLGMLNVDLSDIHKKLNYPGPHLTNPLYKIFDQIFYGPKLYKKIFHKQSIFKERGLIENDDVIATKKLLTTLEKKFKNKMAMVTGRGEDSTVYSLGQLFDKFNADASVFLEDHPRRMAKPNTKSLLMSINALDSKYCVYVGDSMEDLIMAKKAKKMGKKVIFCGIYGTSENPKSKKSFLEKNNADMILESITLLPKALNLAN